MTVSTIFEFLCISAISQISDIVTQCRNLTSEDLALVYSVARALNVRNLHRSSTKVNDDDCSDEFNYDSDSESG